VAKIDDFSDIINTDQLVFTIIGSSFSSQNILKVKWVPFTKTHLAVLKEDNNFLIFDFGTNIDEAEISVDLNFLDPKKNLISERTTNFEDFSFSCNKDGYDCGIFSVFFMNNWGEIYYKCPLIINGMRVPKSTIEFLNKRIEHEKKTNTDRDLIERIESFVKSIKELFIDAGANYKIDVSKAKGNLNENVIQGLFLLILFIEWSNNCLK